MHACHALTHHHLPKTLHRYFARGRFTLPQLDRSTQGYSGALTFMVDDGAVLFVNGVEVTRINVADTAYSVYVGKHADQLLGPCSIAPSYVQVSPGPTVGMHLFLMNYSGCSTPFFDCSHPEVTHSLVCSLSHPSSSPPSVCCGVCQLRVRRHEHG